MIAGHPIIGGVSDFPNPQYDNYGGGARAGSTVLIQHNGIDAGEAWELGLGRAVYLGSTKPGELERLHQPSVS